MKFHEKLRLICETRKISQAQLRQDVGEVSKSTMTNWFNGLTKPDYDSAFRIARELNVPISWLADEQADYPPPSQDDAMDASRFSRERLEPDLTDDERTIVRVYRHLKAKGYIDEGEALYGLSLSVRLKDRKHETHLSGPLAHFDPEVPVSEQKNPITIILGDDVIPKDKKR